MPSNSDRIAFSELQQISTCLEKYAEAKHGVVARVLSAREYESRDRALQIGRQARARSLRIRLRGYLHEFAHIPLATRLVHYPGQAYCIFILVGWGDLPEVFALIDRAFSNAAGGDYRIRSRRCAA